EDLQVSGGDLELAGGQLGVLVAGRPAPDLAGHQHAELRAQVMCDVLLAQLDEHHAAMVAAARYPAGQRDLLSRIRGAHRASLVRADHRFPSLSLQRSETCGETGAARSCRTPVHSPLAGPEDGASPARKGLDCRSAPIVVCGPCPDRTTVSSGSGRHTRARLARIVS